MNIKLNIKTISIVIAIIIFQFANSQTISFSKDELKRINPLIQKGVKIKNDEHEGVSWIKSKNVDIVRSDTFNSSTATMSIYFGITKINGKVKVMPLRIVNTLNVDNWIFFDKISILYGTLKQKRNGTREKFTIYDDDTVRNASGGGVTEKSDVVVSDEVMLFLKAITSNPKPIHIRYSGKEKYYEKFYGVFLKKFPKKLLPVLDSYLALVKEFEKDK